MTTLTYQERFKTLKGVFDQFTNRNLFELESHKIFDQLTSPFSIGKESNVFLAKKGKQTLIVKIYRLQNRDFKRMFNYIKKDPRYTFLKNKSRDIVLAWTQREYRNLLLAQKAKINSPKPLAIKNNIIIEEMIGDQRPAPQLKDQPPKNPKRFLRQLLVQLERLYQGSLIHGDLSAFNILNHQEKPYLIDFSQATLTRTPNSEELLQRDLKNILQFFQKLGIRENPEKLFKGITGKEAP